MSTTDDSYLVAKDKTADIPLREKWWRILDNYKVGIIPLPFFILAGVLILLDCTEGKLPSDIVVMVAPRRSSVSPVANSANACR